MFDPPTQRYPKKWSEMSLDYKLMFLYHGTVMVLFVAGASLTVQNEIVVAGLMVVLLVTMSLWHRRVSNWHWPSVSQGNALKASLTAVAIGFFMFAGSSQFPLSDHRDLPWYLGVLGIGVFAILSSLRLVDSSKADFIQNCRIIDQYGREVERTPPPPGPIDSEPAWKRTVRGIYTVAFLMVWVLFVAFFWSFNTGLGHGAPAPTADRVEPLTNHGQTVFVTRAEKERTDDLELVSGIGMPLVIVGGFILHFLIGVKLFPNTPSLSEYRAERSSRS